MGIEAPSTAEPPWAGPSDRSGLAGRAWALLLDCFFAHRDRHLDLAAGMGLTMGGMKTLLSLEPGTARPMGSLAEEWGCDASNVTWLVDRLEEKGWVERRTLPADRRVKAVALTPDGEEARAELLGRIYDPPAAVQDLPEDDLEALVRILGRLA